MSRAAGHARSGAAAYARGSTLLTVVAESFDDTRSGLPANGPSPQGRPTRGASIAPRDTARGPRGLLLARVAQAASRAAVLLECAVEWSRDTSATLANKIVIFSTRSCANLAGGRHQLPGALRKCSLSETFRQICATA